MAWTERTELLVGPEGLGKLRAAAVAVVGCGGVGAAAAEMLARACVGHIALIDSDSISESNINRQLPALHSTVGLPKTGVLAGRLKDINPDLNISGMGKDLVAVYETAPMDTSKIVSTVMAMAKKYDKKKDRKKK